MGPNFAKQTSWLSTHIYFKDFSEIDSFILYCLHPLVTKFKKENIIKKYFFIRFADETGIHVRFRVLQNMKFKNKIVENQINQSIEEHFKSFCRNKIIETNKYSRSPYTHYTEVYEPEYLRYGENEGMIISEDHFQDSSNLAIKILQNSNEDESQKMLYVIQSIISLAYSAGLRGKSMAQYFNILFAKDYNELEIFYKPNRIILLQTINATLGMLTRNLGYEDLIGLKEWQNNCESSLKEIRKLLNQNIENPNYMSYGKDLFESFKNLNDYYSNPSIFFKLLTLVLSYSHMTFNRIGFLKESEKYIYGVIGLSLSDYYGL